MRNDLTASDSKIVVFYDGACPLCRAEVRQYGRSEGAQSLCLRDVSQPQAQLPAALSRAQAMARFHVLAADGRLLSGARAFIEVWRRLPAWRMAARVAAMPGMTVLLELGYRLFLRLRPAIVWAFVTARRMRAGS